MSVAEPGIGADPGRRRSSVPGTSRRRTQTQAMPYLLILPSLAILAVVVAYPLGKLLVLSFQHYELPELIAGKGRWIGVDNYRRLLADSTFWVVVLRTVVFTAVNVALTIVFGTLIALLLERLSSRMRAMLAGTLVLVWATPVVVAIDLWQWMVDFEFGVVNWLLTHVGVGNFIHHNWFSNSVEGFGVITAVVVWGAIPFVALTVYAGLTQVPAELREAAIVDGASAWRVFWSIKLPLVQPVLIVVTSLSIIWDFQVFNQVWIMLSQRPTQDYFLLGIYSFATSFSLHNYGAGSTIAVVMVMMLLAVTLFYVRRMSRLGEFD